MRKVVHTNGLELSLDIEIIAVIMSNVNTRDNFKEDAAKVTNGGSSRVLGWIDHWSSFH